MPFGFKKTEIPEVVLIKAEVFADERGSFEEVFKYPDFKENGIDANFTQVNLSISKKNVLRGLHYQTNPEAMGKFIRVLGGEIFDVAVDIRKSSPTYAQWVGVNLSRENGLMLYIPEGFAHGFCVLSDEAEVMYYCTNVYSPENDRGISWNDPTLNISWPIQTPNLSEKDAKQPTLEEADNNF